MDEFWQTYTDGYIKIRLHTLWQPNANTPRTALGQDHGCEPRPCRLIWHGRPRCHHPPAAARRRSRDGRRLVRRIQQAAQVPLNPRRHHRTPRRHDQPRKGARGSEQQDSHGAARDPNQPAHQNL